MPKVFISHSWEDNEIARKLAEYLRRDGVEVWIDYAKIRGGDSLPEVIGVAIEWCDTFILVWSNSAANSYFVKLEWTTAVTNQKRIIPCAIENINLPIILSGFLYIKFDNFEQGYQNLARTMKFEIKEKKQESLLSKNKTKQIISLSTLRSRPARLSKDEIKAMLKIYGFYDSVKNKKGIGYCNQFELITHYRDQPVVINHALSLMWMQGGTSKRISFIEAKKWIKENNRESYAGFNNWRLPTIEEAMSLVENKKDVNNLYINPIFNKKQSVIWTSDYIKGKVPWRRIERLVVYFSSGKCFNLEFDTTNEFYVRAVRPV